MKLMLEHRCSIVKPVKTNRSTTALRRGMLVYQASSWWEIRDVGLTVASKFACSSLCSLNKHPTRNIEADTRADTHLPNKTPNFNGFKKPGRGKQTKALYPFQLISASIKRKQFLISGPALARTSSLFNERGINKHCSAS